MPPIIGNLGSGKDTVVVGGFTFDINDPRLKILTGHMTTADNFSTLREGDGTPYEVPGGKKYTMLAIKAAQVLGTAVGADVTVGYGDTNVDVNSGSAPTFPKYIGGDAQIGVLGLGSDDQRNQKEPFFFVVPAAKFPFVRNHNNVSCSFHVWGYEETA